MVLPVVGGAPAAARLQVLNERSGAGRTPNEQLPEPIPAAPEPEGTEPVGTEPVPVVLVVPVVPVVLVLLELALVVV